MQADWGNWLVIAGLGLVLLGALVKLGVLGWLGNLPGDINVKRDGFRLFIPLTSMLVVSVILSLLAAVIRRFF